MLHKRMMAEAAREGTAAHVQWRLPMRLLVQKNSRPDRSAVLFPSMHKMIPDSASL
jgi:hypothetical protein